MLVRALIGVPGWGEARVEGRVDPRGVEGRVEAGGVGSLRVYRRLRRRRRWSLPRSRSRSGRRRSGRRTRRRRGESSSAEEEDTAEDTSTLAVWLRGPSRLPDRPIPVAFAPADSTERGYVSNLTCYYYFFIS